jgi:hypothetical protein
MVQRMQPFPLPALLAAAVTFAPFAAAQIQVGDIAMTGFSTSSFGLRLAATPSVPVVALTTPGFQGSGPGTSQAILEDASVPDSFLIGGFGFLGRATLVAPSSVSYQLLTSSIGIVAQMSQDALGNVVFADGGTGQVRQLDVASGVVTDITVGAQPWGLDLNAGALDPLTGDFVAGGNGALWRLPAGATSANATPIATGLGGYVTGVAFDPENGDVLATLLTVNRVIRVDAAGNVTNIAPPGSVPGPNALSLDENGDLVTGGGTGQVHRIPRVGGAPVFLVNNTSPLGNVNGVAVVGSGGFGRAFGSGCTASLGPATLRASGPFRTGSTAMTTSTNHAPNTVGLLVLGLSDTVWLGNPLPLLLDPLLGTAGCSLLVSGDATLAGVASASSPAQLSFALALPPSLAGARFFAQHVGLESVPGGLSWSNGIAFRIR